MRVFANVTLIGKVSKKWKNMDGIEQTSYSCHIMQCDGTIVETMRITQAQFDTLISGKSYVFTADYGTGKNGGYLRIVDIQESK